MHPCEGEAVTKLTNEKIPYFNAPIYLENKTQVGKVEEIFGPINESVSRPVLGTVTGRQLGQGAGAGHGLSLLRLSAGCMAVIVMAGRGFLFSGYRREAQAVGRGHHISGEVC